MPRKKTTPQPRPCGYCETTFVPQRSDAKFCSVNCRVLAYQKRSRELARADAQREARNERRRTLHNLRRRWRESESRRAILNEEWSIVLEDRDYGGMTNERYEYHEAEYDKKLAALATIVAGIHRDCVRQGVDPDLVIGWVPPKPKPKSPEKLEAERMEREVKEAEKQCEIDDRQRAFAEETRKREIAAGHDPGARRRPREKLVLRVRKRYRTVKVPS